MADQGMIEGTANPFVAAAAKAQPNLLGASVPFSKVLDKAQQDTPEEKARRTELQKMGLEIDREISTIMDAPIQQADGFTRWVARGLGVNLSDQTRRRRLAAVAPLYQARLNIMQEQRLMSDPNPVETDIARRELNEIQATMEVGRRGEFVDGIRASDKAGMFNDVILEAFKHGYANLSDAMLTQEDSDLMGSLKDAFMLGWGPGTSTEDAPDPATVNGFIDYAESIGRLDVGSANAARFGVESRQAGSDTVTLTSDSGLTLTGDGAGVLTNLRDHFMAERLSRFTSTGRVKQTRVTDQFGIQSESTGLFPKGLPDLNDKQYDELRLDVTRDLFFETYEGGNMGDNVLPFLRPDEQREIMMERSRRRRSRDKSSVAEELESRK